ncbi:hypothetical protein QTP88_012137 [Uroleucon formosanum]
MIISRYLEKKSVRVSIFKNNIPGTVWVNGFLKRHPNLSVKVNANIKKTRANITADDIQEYMDRLEKTLSGTDNSATVDCMGKLSKSWRWPTKKTASTMSGAEMTVARNCAIQLSNKFGLKELKQVINKIVYPNLFKLLQVALVLPILSASCERSFSAMRRIKSWTRTTMGQYYWGV